MKLICVICCLDQGHNYQTQMLLRAINMSGKLHMVPSIINEDYVIRFAVCAPTAVEDDVVHAWNVISETATEIGHACRVTGTDNEALQVGSVIALPVGLF